MSQNYQFIKLEQSGPRATLTLSRPPVNVLNLAMMGEVLLALEEIRSNAAIRLLIIRGEGRCFSAGMDVGDHMPDKVRTMLAAMHGILQSLAGMEIPVMSVLHGMALGGALEIAMMTDLVYAESGCKIGQPEIQLGVFPPAAAALYPAWFGRRVTSDLVLTGRTISAEEALRMGLINGVFVAEELEMRIREIALVLLSRSRPALASAKLAIRKGADENLWERLKSAEHIYLEELMRKEDAIEGLQAFLEKRQPQWKHR